MFFLSECNHCRGTAGP